MQVVSEIKDSGHQWRLILKETIKCKHQLQQSPYSEVEKILTTYKHTIKRPVKKEEKCIPKTHQKIIEATSPRCFSSLIKSTTTTTNHPLCFSTGPNEVSVLFIFPHFFLLPTKLLQLVQIVSKYGGNYGLVASKYEGNQLNLTPNLEATGPSCLQM